MANSYLLIEPSGFLGASQWDIFVPTAGDDNDYYCVQQTDVVIDKTTLDAYPGTFEPIEVLTPEQKNTAWSRKYDQGISWTPDLGDYFASEADNLALYKIVDEDTRGDEKWGYILLSGGSLFSSVKFEAKKNFSQGRLHVTAFDVDDSSSASGSDSGSASGS